MKSLNAFALASLVFLTTTTSRAQSAYFNAVTNLNPVGYWPMHEVEPAAQGDIETNYGTLGPLGEGFYPDWAVGGPVTSIKRGAPGALANDSDQAVNFTRGASPGAGTYTNYLYVPHTSPLATLNPPFTVECWFYPTNLASEDIWAQNGYEGLNAGGNEGAGVGSVGGIRLVWMNGTNTGFEIYTFNNSATLNTIGFAGNLGGSAAYPSNNWYHLVVTCDANTNISLYINGSQASLNSTTTNGPGSYTPDYWTPLTIGGGRGGTRATAGYIDEFAVYTNVLQPGDISAHYNDALSGAAGQYFADVIASNPAIYLRMDAPATYTPPLVGTWPVLNNYGITNGVAIGNGVYSPGTAPGLVANPIVNPNGVPFGGVSGKVAQLSGVSSFADAGSAAAYNPTGSNANFTVTALFRGNPADNRTQSIVGHGTNSWQMSLNTNGCIVFNAGNGNKAAGGIGQAAGDIKTTRVYNDGNWHQVVAVNTTNVISVYVDGVLDTNGTPVGIAATNIIPGNTSDVMIGSDPTYTNNPAGVGRSFAGQICEVAFFTNALTFSQIQTLYSNCEVAPFITGQPVTGRAINGGPGSFIYFGVLANGTPSLAYQWYFNTTSNYSGATKLVDNVVHYTNSTSLQVTITNLTVNDSGYYYAVIMNNYGSVTSTLASLTVYAAPTLTSQFPVLYTNLFTLYAGANPTFSISAVGAQPINYFWYTNGVLDAAATGSSMVWTNVSIGSISNYCVLTNIAGPATSMVWMASVIAAPDAPYPQSVLALSPIGYWRLNDTNLDGVDNGSGGSGNNNDGDDGWIANDYAGGNDGIYTNVSLGNEGYDPTTDPSDTSAQFGETGLSFADSLVGQIQGTDFAITNGANGEFTVEAWAWGYSGGQILGAPIATKGMYNDDDEFNLGIDSTKTHYRFYVRSANGTVYTAGSGSSPALDNAWQHVVGVCDETNGQLLFYVNGILASTTAIPTNSGIYEAPEPMSIGAGSTDGVNFTNQFYGYINDVAVYNRALSQSQVVSQYVSVGAPPSFMQPPPSNAVANSGGVLIIPSTVIGTPNMTNWWSDVNGGTNVVTNLTNGNTLNATLTVSNVPASWNNDHLELTVSNAYGSTNFFVTLTVYTNAPQIVTDLPSQITIVSGISYTYSISVVGPQPYTYQWYNGVTPIANQTNSTYSLTAGSPGSTTYSVVITNIYGATTSSVSTFTSVAQLTNSYGTNLLQFKPVGYWPMHEVEAAVPGDIETNYGSLGLLGTGYYPDWATNTQNGAQIIRGVPGALANDTDTAVSFTKDGGNISGDFTNEVFVPHTSPLSTLNPPFSVECWFYPTKTNSQDIWDQFGWEGLNAGNSGGGVGNACGIRLVWENGATTGFEIYAVNNSSNQNTIGFSGVSGENVSPLTNWYHLVVTCDANTNISLFTNGVQASLSNMQTTNGPGSYSPDYWTPLTIGGGRGGTRAVGGNIDEFAVYTNVITDIAQHYSDGINESQAGVYVADVMNDHPVIYLRMDAPAVYSPPNADVWPVLINYGSVGSLGVYAPGTMPGIVPGPAAANGTPFIGLSGTNVAELSGVSSFADAGYAPAYNPVGAVPFSVAALFRGNPCDGRVQTIVGHSTNSWGIWMNTTGNLVCYLGTNNPGGLTSSGVYNDGKWHQVVAVYAPNSNPALTGTGAIYVDGALDTSFSSVSTNGIEPGSPMDVMIGTDPQFTNSPPGVGQQFAGQICEVALFTNALTATQVQQLYSATVPFTVNANPTNIVAAVTNNNLYLTWPADHTGWQLQAQTNSVSKGLSTNWVNYNPSTGTNQVVIPINLTNGTVFYRLSY